MDKEKAKQILEVMLEIDIPIGEFLITPPKKYTDGSIDNPFQKDNQKKVEEYYQRVKAFCEFYRSIDETRLNKETGKTIVKKVKPLMKKYYQWFSEIREAYVEGKFQHLGVPQALMDIKDKINELSGRFRNLKSRDLYEKAWGVKYFEMDRPEWLKEDEWFGKDRWFLANKPTKIHPEKLKLVLEDLK